MPSAPSNPDAPWWRRRTPSMGVLAAILAVLVIATAVVANNVASVLGDVPKNRLGEDTWDAPLGIEKINGLTIAHLPACAAGSITRIALWDEESNPYWEVSGPPTPMPFFAVGAEPKGFRTVVPFRKPPRGALLRLVAFRRVGGPLGLRYTEASLVEARVVSGLPLKRYSRDGFLTAEVCGDATASGGDNTQTSEG